ncbi:EpsG family protein [Aidingimonas halophila]|uniref:EpsG family protein n=1 Tax=Aidingimonas halophila TaxID=574349 RepID=A0A1H3CQM3_9GAMM|nr:EpsG family protein [Aidingimonas halophila]SDX56447.1 EpsG family protein [Aidingimonas halophila]
MSLLFFLNYVNIVFLIGFSKLGRQRLGIAFVSCLWALYSASSIIENTDITAYQNAYHRMSGGEFYTWNHDYVFWVLMYVFARAGLSFSLFYFVIVFFINYFIISTAQRYLSDNNKFYAFVAIFVASSSFVFFQNNILRQGLAFAILLPVILGLTRLRIYHFLSLGVHFSSFILIFLRSKKIILAFSIGTVILFFSYSWFSDMFWIAQKTERLMAKDHPVYYLWLFSSLFFLLMLFRGKLDLWLVSLSIFLLALSLMPYVGYRVSFYFQPLILILALEKLRLDKISLIIIFFFSLFISFVVYSHSSVMKLTGYNIMM